MEKREEPREREKAWRPEKPVGGGPESPGGDTEPSNWPGETRERGMRPPDLQPILPNEPDER